MTETTSKTPVEWWTPQEAARRYRVSPLTINRLCCAGKIKAKRVGKCWRIHVSAIEEYERVGKVTEPVKHKPDMSEFDNVEDFIGQGAAAAHGK